MFSLAFCKDTRHTCSDHAAYNLAVLHHIALNLTAKGERTVLGGIKAKELKANKDHRYSLPLIFHLHYLVADAYHLLMRLLEYITVIIATIPFGCDAQMFPRLFKTSVAHENWRRSTLASSLSERKLFADG